MTLFSSMIRMWRGPTPRPEPEQAQDLPEAQLAALSPDQPLCVIGDIHGCASLLDILSRKIAEEVDDDTRIIGVGDYVDRGDASADVLRMLMAEATPTGSRLTCLAGNHEDMLLGFLDDPQQTGPRWLRYGGLQTLASFGLRGISETMSGTDLERARDGLREAMGPELEHWLRGLPLYVQSGNVAVVHAGANPDLPILQQDRKSLLWGHAEFFRRPRSDGLWVAHGHTVVPEIRQQGGRISVDTGAYATGRLSAAILYPDGGTRHLST
ncbi:metallophosphoesterase [Frigidibacter sp.]|uniref:metallophosphoesterase n=1 Tax=Frigidibacter sp. TaxID=2586418 RepID=UPI0027359713|nr:metallophosphoesterase [Frigidibacter sp.]MDP3340202.1 metallophosphoesterase [Frigidibacter sp.]